jgi:hypothetical protein
MQRYYQPQFLTLTFKKQYTMSDLILVRREFHLFVSRFNFEFFNSKESKIKYSSVIELSKKYSAIHYHVLFYNLPFIANLDDSKEGQFFWRLVDTWRNGRVFNRSGIQKARNAGSYLTKYMSKDFAAENLPKGFRLYNNSHGLLKPEVFLNGDALRVMSSLNPSFRSSVRYSEMGTYEQYFVPHGFSFNGK